MAPARISPPAPTPPPQKLTSTQLNQFKEDGYLIIPNALSSEIVSALLAETRSLLSSFSLTDHPMTKFSTGESSSHVGDDYFLTSGDKIRFFFEEDAFSPATSSTTDDGDQISNTNKLLKAKELAINKIGHYLHELSPTFQSATFTNLHASIARAVGFKDPRVLQSMVICKQPEIGGRVPPHQDSTFLYTNPPSAVGFWVALEDATADNGCLSFAKGSHRRVPVTSRFVRKDGGREGTTFEDVVGAKFPLNEDLKGAGKTQGVAHGKYDDDDGDEHQYQEYPDDEKYELGPVKAGTLVLIHGNLLHKSEKNLSGKSRFIYTFHVIEGEHEYDERNWLQPPEGVGFSRLIDPR